jgi:hypothetical protein
VVAVLALLAAVPIALLPATAREVPAEAVLQAEAAVRKSLPRPFEAAPLDLATLHEHLAAAGPACRADPRCVCAAAPFEAGTRAIELDVQWLSPQAWAGDLRLVAPCEGLLLDRKAAAVEASAAALARFVAEATGAILRGRDLGPLKYSEDPRRAATSATATSTTTGTTTATSTATTTGTTTGTTTTTATTTPTATTPASTQTRTEAPARKLVLPDDIARPLP